MRQFSKLLLIVILSSLFACSNDKKDKAQILVEKPISATNAASENVKKKLSKALKKDPRKIGPAKPKSQYKIEENIYKINASDNPLYGYWVGAFGKNKINIAIAHIDGDSIFGHSVCAGNFRPIKGKINSIDGDKEYYQIYMKEPGDDKYDGEFGFTINLNTDRLNGIWKPYKNVVAAKKYSLIKRNYFYSKTAGDSNASSEYLSANEVSNLLPEEIEMIRNEIYARHGYSFKNIKMRRIFDEKTWYIPMSVDIRDQLTELEAQNIDMLYNYEEYYEEYYDSYGR